MISTLANDEIPPIFFAEVCIKHYEDELSRNNLSNPKFTNHSAAKEINQYFKDIDNVNINFKTLEE